MDRAKSILFLCVANSARSQMAEDLRATALVIAFAYRARAALPLV